MATGVVSPPALSSWRRVPGRGHWLAPVHVAGYLLGLMLVHQRQHTLWHGCSPRALQRKLGVWHCSRSGSTLAAATLAITPLVNLYSDGWLKLVHLTLVDGGAFCGSLRAPLLVYLSALAFSVLLQVTAADRCSSLPLPRLWNGRIFLLASGAPIQYRFRRTTQLLCRARRMIGTLVVDRLHQQSALPVVPDDHPATCGRSTCGLIVGLPPARPAPGGRWMMLEPHRACFGPAAVVLFASSSGLCSLLVDAPLGNTTGVPLSAAAP